MINMYKLSNFKILSKTNDGENLTTGFSPNKQNLIFKAGLTPAVLPWKRHIVQSNYQNKKVGTFNLYLANSGHSEINSLKVMTNEA